MYDVTMKQLLEAGIHFGHQTKRWNPKMRPYIYTQRNGIYVMDLQQTLKMLKEAYNFVVDVTKNGGTVMFVGTKKQAQDSIAFEATRCGSPFVNHRWLGGTMTNFGTMQARIRERNDLDKAFQEGGFALRTKKENQKLSQKLERMNRFFFGLKDLKRLPDALFIIDLKKEQNAVKEAKKLHIPVVGIIDTNCDPDDADYPIPGNDDAIRAIKLFCQTMSNAVMEGKEGQDAPMTESQSAKAAEAPVVPSIPVEEFLADAAVLASPAPPADLSPSGGIILE
ncbi:MAG: 30S ribosomal protein S2 [bacterium]|nr:30S ribosomal protein S2 [bacterium]